jgi:PA14 domain
LRRWRCSSLWLMLMPPVIGALALQRKPAGYYGLIGFFYEGLEPGHNKPHIVRVDRNIDFDSLIALGSPPLPSSVLWSARIFGPSNGMYQFMIAADDDGWQTIDGVPVIRDPGKVSKDTDGGRINLTSGCHNIQVGQRNIWGRRRNASLLAAGRRGSEPDTGRLPEPSAARR